MELSTAAAFSERSSQHDFMGWRIKEEPNTLFAMDPFDQFVDRFRQGYNSRPWASPDHRASSISQRRFRVVQTIDTRIPVSVKLRRLS
jgi:hypothetical protein